MDKCKLICMSFDGDYVTEYPQREDYFESVKDAWKYDDDMGSKWYFYPFHFVVTASGETIKDTPCDLPMFKGKRVRTVANLFEKVSKLPDAQEMNCDEYVTLLWNYTCS